MLKAVRPISALAVLCAVVIVAAGCGGGGGGKQGGSISIGTVGPDSYDPVMFQTVQAVSALHLVYTPLVVYRDSTGPSSADLVPGLADSVPTPTNGGKTYTFKLRPNLVYSDGSPVKASDFTHEIKRLLFLGGPFASFFSDIVGANKYVAAKKENAPLPGIVDNDQAGEIKVTLNKPDSRFPFAAAEPAAAPTPAAKSPFKNLTANPPPGLGPYTMKIINPSREYILTKNPKFNIPGMAKGKVDKIDGKVSNDVNQMAEDIINGKLDYMTEDPSGDLLPQVQAKYSSRFRLDPNPPNTYYFFMNVTTPPFDKLQVRQAVNYAIDSRALVRIFGGRLKPTCNFLPPAMVGYQEYTPCPWGDPNGPGNIPKAKSLIQSAGATGAKVTVWTNSKAPRPAIGEYLRSTLNQIGLKASVKTLNQQVYFSTIGRASTKAQIGFTDWFQDFPHPGDFFGPNLSGESLASTPTFNNSYVNDPQINSTITKLLEQPPKADASQWAALDREVSGPSKAYVANYGNELASTFMSDRMNFKDCSGAPHLVYRNDWSLFCLK
jgi:peptide/nickel transport system substrate-binding protein